MKTQFKSKPEDTGKNLSALGIIMNYFGCGNVTAKNNNGHLQMAIAHW